MNNLKNKHARVMILVQDMWSECALQMYEVSLKYLLKVIKLQSGHEFVSDRWTDRKTDARGKTIFSRPFQGGDIIIN